MKKMLIGVAIVVAAAAVLRFFGPALGQRAMKRCADMFGQLPEDFPPKRMMRSLEEIRQQNTQILRHLEQAEQQPAAQAADA